MSAPEASKRVKGRPRKEVNATASSVKIQREKNRQAQSIFRARRRATEAANELRISQLENTVERMGDTFLTLVNHVIHSNRKKRDLELAGKLQECIHTFLTLAATSSDQIWDDSPNIGNQVDMRQSTPHMICNPGTEGTAGPAAVVEDASSSQQASNLPLLKQQNSGNLWSLLDQFDSSSSLFPELPGPPTNVLGNGWTTDLPFAYTATLSQAVRYPVAQSISTLIIQATLYYVYYILLEANDISYSDVAKNIFGYALKLHSREELLSNIRWFLGPGQREAYRLGIAGFQGVAGFEILDTQDLGNIPTLNPSVDSDALSDIQAKPIHSTSPHLALLNANGVESYLLYHGMRRIAQDVLEIDLGQQEKCCEAQSEPFFTINPNLISADVFFPAVSKGGSRAAATSTEQASTTRTVRFSESTFIRLLVTQASHCLTYGPGYRKDRLPDLLEAASIPTWENNNQIDYQIRAS
ncbi:hypothetical protein GGI43DRAFT_311536 [Trichoderma evansii]